jgi:hypothetical protein
VVLGAIGGQDAPQPVAPAAARDPAERGLHGLEVEDAADLRLVDGSGEPGVRECLGEVHNRAGHAGDRDGVNDVAIFSAQATGGVHRQPSVPRTAARGRDLDAARARAEQPPQPPGRTVTQYSFGSACKDGGELLAA